MIEKNIVERSAPGVPTAGKFPRSQSRFLILGDERRYCGHIDAMFCCLVFGVPRQRTPQHLLIYPPRPPHSDNGNFSFDWGKGMESWDLHGLPDMRPGSWRTRSDKAFLKRSWWQSLAQIDPRCAPYPLHLPKQPVAASLSR